MGKYIAFYNGKEMEVEAGTMLEAMNKAREVFKPPKSKQHMVHCRLIEVDGRKVQQSTML